MSDIFSTSYLNDLLAQESSLLADGNLRCIHDVLFPKGFLFLKRKVICDQYFKGELLFDEDLQEFYLYAQKIGSNTATLRIFFGKFINTFQACENAIETIRQMGFISQDNILFYNKRFYTTPDLLSNNQHTLWVKP